MQSDLEQAIEQTDLPALIFERFPDAAAHRGAFVHATRASLCAAWRNEKSPSVSLTLKGGRWLWHDFGNHTGGNAFQFLTRVCGLTPGQAAQELLKRAGLANTAQSNSRPVQTESDRLEQEFKRLHPNADPDFFADWLEIRATGWREIGLQPSGPIKPWVSPTLPDLPAAALGDNRTALASLGAWIAACIGLEIAHETSVQRKAA